MGANAWMGIAGGNAASPTDLSNNQQAASTLSSSSPLQPKDAGKAVESGLAAGGQAAQTTDYSGGNPYLTGLNYGGPSGDSGTTIPIVPKGDQSGTISGGGTPVGIGSNNLGLSPYTPGDPYYGSIPSGGVTGSHGQWKPGDPAIQLDEYLGGSYTGKTLGGDSGAGAGAKTFKDVSSGLVTPGQRSTLGTAQATGLNYGAFGALPASPPLPGYGQGQLPGGGTLPQTQSFAQAAANKQNIFGNMTPAPLQNIPNIRQNPNGQWSDGEGRLYNPQTGAVFYDPGGAGSNAPGQYTPPIPPYQPTPNVNYGPQAAGGSVPGGFAGTLDPNGALIQGQAAATTPTLTAQRNVANSSVAGDIVDLAGPGGVGNQPTGSPSLTGPTPTATPTTPQGSTWNITTPTAREQVQPTVNPSGVPNTYNQFTNYQRPPQFTGANVPGTMFSGNNGAQQGAVGGPPSGFGVVPPFSPAMSQMYYNFLLNQIGQGATPYGQQNTFLPGQPGGSSMQGLTAPETDLARRGREGLQDFTRYVGGMLDPAKLNSLRGEYQPLTNVGQSFSQYGGYGTPGEQTGLQAQYGARGNAQDPYGLYTGAQALQGAASGQGTPGLPGQYLNSAMQYGGMGLPADIQSRIAQYGAGPGAGGQTLSNMAQSGQPTDVGPAWEAMKAAQQRNIDQQAAQIRERMGLSGNLGMNAGGQALGTPYNTALTDFYAQTARDQNAALTSASQQAQEAARQRQLGAAGTMSGQQLGAAQNLGGLQQQAGLYGAGQQFAGSQYLQNLMAQGAGQMGQNQLTGLGMTGNLTAQSQQTPYNIYGNLLGLQQGNINNMASLGQQYQGLDQAAINRQYQEYLRTQPEYSPMLQQMYAAANTFPGMASTQFPSGVGTAIGQIIGGAVGSGGALTRGNFPWP